MTTRRRQAAARGGKVATARLADLRKDAYQSRFAEFRAQGVSRPRAAARAAAAVRDVDPDLFAQLLAEEYRHRVEAAGGPAASPSAPVAGEPARCCRVCGAPEAFPPPPAESRAGSLGASAEWTARVLAWMADNYARPLRAEDVAAATGISTSTLNRAFLLVIGRAPMQVLRDIRRHRPRPALAGQQPPAPNSIAGAAPHQAEPPPSGPRQQTDTAEETILAMIRTGLLAPGDLVPASATLAEAIPHVPKAVWNRAKLRLLRKGVLARPGLNGPMRVAGQQAPAPGADGPHAEAPASTASPGRQP